MAVIMAHSPQAKGRVERVNGTLQDRLVKALRRAKISDRHSANRFLQEKFLPAFNRRFVRKAAKPGDLHRRVPRGLDLDRVLSIRETRVVQNDWTLRFENRWFQLAETHQKLALAGREVTVSRRLDGRLELLYGGRELSYRELCVPPPRRERAKRRFARTKVNGRRPTIRGGGGCLGPVAGVAGWGRRRSGSLRSPPRRRPHPEVFLTFTSPRGHFYL